MIDEPLVIEEMLPSDYDDVLARLRARGIQKCHICHFDENRNGQAFWSGTGWTARTDLQVMSRAT